MPSTTLDQKSSSSSDSEKMSADKNSVKEDEQNALRLGGTRWDNADGGSSSSSANAPKSYSIEKREINDLDLEQDDETGPLLGQKITPHSSPCPSLSSSQQLTKESFDLIKFSVPIISGLLIGNFNKVIAVFSVGHRSSTELAAASLAFMYSNLSGYSIVLGITSGLETLCSQAVTGATDKRKAGEYLQQAIAATSVIILPLLITWFLSEHVLLFLGQDPELAHMAKQFLMWGLPDLYPALVYFAMTRFLSAQGITAPIFWVEVLNLPLSAFFQWLFVWSPTPFNIGFVGASLAIVLVDLFSAVAIVLYALYVDGHQCWKPWSFKVAFDLDGWRQFFSLGVPGLLMVCSEWWAYELVSVFAGWFGKDALAGNAIILNVLTLFYSIFYGFGLAVANQIGNSLGEGDHPRAKRLAKISLSLTLASSTCCALALFIFRSDWYLVFTDDEATGLMVAAMIPTVAVFHIFDASNAVLSGVIRGIGRQHFAALMNSIGFYLIAPIAGLICVNTHFGVLGLWIGLFTAAVYLTLTETYYTFFVVSWPEVAEEALERVNSHNESGVEEGRVRLLHDDTATSQPQPTISQPTVERE